MKTKVKKQIKLLILKRLKATIDMLKGLNPEQFNYSYFVQVFDSETNQGIICGVSGWYPKYFPESGLHWINNNNISLSLQQYHNLKYEIILCLFHGHSLMSPFIPDLWTLYQKEVPRLNNIQLKDVIIRFETVYNAIDKNLITNYISEYNENGSRKST